MRHLLTPAIALALTLTFAGCWSSEPAGDTEGAPSVGKSGSAPPTPASEAMGYMPEGAMAAIVMPPVAEMEAKYWSLIEGSVAKYQKLGGEGVEDPVPAIKKMIEDVLADWTLEGKEVPTNFTDAFKSDGVDTDRSMAIFLSLNSLPNTEEPELEDFDFALYVPISDGDLLRETLEGIRDEFEGKMAEGKATPGGLDTMMLEVEDLSVYSYIGDDAAYVSTNFDWLDGIHARRDAPAKTQYAPGAAVQPKPGEIALYYDATLVLPLIEEAKEDPNFNMPANLPRSMTDGEWGVTTLTIEADGIEMNSIGHFAADSDYAQFEDSDLDLLPRVQSDAGAVIALKIDEKMRAVTLSDMQRAAALNPMGGMAMMQATPWLNLLDDEIVLAASGIMGFQPIIMGAAEVSDAAQAKEMLESTGLPLMPGGEYKGYEKMIAQAGFVQVHMSFIENVLVVATDPVLFQQTVDGVIAGGGVSGAKVVDGIPTNSQFAIAADVAKIEKAIESFPMSPGSVDEAFAGGRTSDVLTRLIFDQRFEGQDQLVNVSLEGDPGLAIIRSMLE